MARRVTISAEDVARFKDGRTIPDVGWYYGEVDSIEDKISSKKDSTNYFVDLKILSMDDGSPSKFAGKKVRRLFNDKAKSYWIPYFTACMEGKPVEPDSILDFDATIGCKLYFKVAHKEYEGKPQAEASEFSFEKVPF